MLKETFLNEKTDVKAERAFMFCLLTYKECQEDWVFEQIKPYMLTDKVCNLVLKAIFKLKKKKETINILTVTKMCTTLHGANYRGDKMAVVVSDLTKGYVSNDNFESIVRILVQYYFQRKGLIAAFKAIEDIRDNDADPEISLKKSFEFISKVASRVYVDDADQDSITTHVNKLRRDIKDIQEGKKEPYLPMGFSEVEKAHNGLTPGDLLIIAARPGMGKTAYAISVARNMAFKGIPVAIYSLEMKGVSLVARMAASVAGINAQLLRNPKLMTDSEEIKYLEAMGRLESLPIFIKEGMRHLEAIEKHSRHLVKHMGVKAIFVDYLTLIELTSSKSNREAEVSYISRRLKAIANELDVPVVALAQLSRAVESRGGEKIPQLADLRESGAIEQDADIVCFLYRPAYYGITQDEQGNDLSKAMKLVIAKNRHGNLSNLYLTFTKETTNVSENPVKKTIINHVESDDDELPF